MNKKIYLKPIFSVLTILVTVIYLISCKSTDGMKIAGPGTTDSTSSSQDLLKTTIVSMSAPLGNLGEYKNFILKGGYSTVVSSSIKTSECTNRSEIEEKFSSDNGKLSEIVLNSDCPSGYKIGVSVFCKYEDKKNKTKCYTGQLNLNQNQLSSYSKLDIYLNLVKVDSDFPGPLELTVPGELTNTILNLEISGVFTPKNQPSSDSEINSSSSSSSSSLDNSSDQEELDTGLTPDSFLNFSCLVQRLFLNFSASICQSQPIKEVTGFDIKCNYYTNSNNYPSTSRFQSVSIGSSTYYPKTVSDLRAVLKQVDSSLVINFLALTELYRNTGKSYECKWTKK